MPARVALAILLLATGCETATAATLQDRIAARGTGPVVFRFETFDNVWGNDEGNINRGELHGRHSGDGGVWDEPGDWTRGPLNILLHVRDHKVRSFKMYVGDRWRGHGGDDVVDLGLIGADEAADWLLDQVETAGEDLAKDSITAATFVKGADIWPRLIRVAKDHSRPEEVRKSCLFWIGNEAGDRATATLTEVVNDNDEDSDVRESAVFALSQRPDDESIPVLMRLARSSPHPEVRRSAFFWLGQKDDPQVIRFLEEVITGG